MRLYLLCVLLVLVLLTFVDAKSKKDYRGWGKHKKKEIGKWKLKKHAADSHKPHKAHKDVNIAYGHKRYGEYDKSYHGGKLKFKGIEGSKIYKKKWIHKFLKKHHGLKKKKLFKKGLKKDLSWLQVKKGVGCGPIQCKYGEVCISSHFDKKPLCVHKKDFKKSMNLFHRYQKKEMKALRKMKKDSLIADFEWLMEQKKLGNLKKKEDFLALKRAYLEKYGQGHFMDDYSKDDKSEKMETKEMTHPKTKKNPMGECSTSEFSQLRMRMTGWFHLLHGQDHLARKAHGGRIKKFYKHVSVKKELREYSGKKCECLKSAMWQFNQMDTEKDDQLSENELSMLVEDSLEPCIKPYLTSCDSNGDRIISSDEWCCCFSNVESPCFKKISEINSEEKVSPYMPRCDKEGYFMREQCKTDHDGARTCWCVDYNGNEIRGTVTSGSAHCAKHAIEEKKKEIPPEV